MGSLDNFYKTKLLGYGFREAGNSDSYSQLGKLFHVPKDMGEGYYWVYGQKDLYDIKIHDFYYHEDSFFDVEDINWPECLSITYYESVSGEEIMPYRRLSAGCIKTFIGSHKTFKAIFHKNIPIRSIGIEIMPAYYEKFLKETYVDDYISPHDAFFNIDQTDNFPEMIQLLRQVWNYHGDGIAAKLFYDSKVAEAVSLVFEYSKNKQNSRTSTISAQDSKLIENVAAYINDHFNCDLTLEHLAHIACMGTTKLKSCFKKIYKCTITEYIQQRRLSHAESLLSSTDFTIEQIVLAVGYRNAGRFASSFQKSTGLFPSEYRKMAQRKIT